MLENVFHLKPMAKDKTVATFGKRL